MISNKYIKSLLRILFYILSGSMVYATNDFIFRIYYDYPDEFNTIQYIGTILTCLLIIEGLFIINNLIKKKLIWIHNKKRIRFALYFIVDLLFVVIIVSIISVLLIQTISSNDDSIATAFDLLIINIIAVVYAFIVVISKVLFNTYNNLKDSIINMERFKKENAEAKFQSLKKQLSPHFLFNILNTLFSIIDKDQTMAKEYLVKISEIYRYVLVNENNELVPLEKEINFARDYAFLIAHRFGDGFIIKFNIPESVKDKFIPPLTLQLLVENAIKHNKLDKHNQLIISIYTDADDLLIVKNNIIEKMSPSNSSGLGLNNLINRHNYLINKKITIEQSNSNFIVKIPLIKVEKYEGNNH